MGSRDQGLGEWECNGPQRAGWLIRPGGGCARVINIESDRTWRYERPCKRVCFLVHAWQVAGG